MARKGKPHHGPGSYRRCRVCRAPVPIKYQWCDQCGQEETYVRLIQEFDAVDVTHLEARNRAILDGTDQPPTTKE